MIRINLSMSGHLSRTMKPRVIALYTSNRQTQTDDVFPGTDECLLIESFRAQNVYGVL